MPTECNPGPFDFGSAEGRRVVAAFDGRRVTSDAGALLLGAADKAIGLIGRLAGDKRVITDACVPAGQCHFKAIRCCTRARWQRWRSTRRTVRFALSIR